MKPTRAFIDHLDEKTGRWTLFTVLDDVPEGLVVLEDFLVREA